MSKKTNTPAADGSPVSTEQQPTVESGSPAFIKQLLETGTTILTAKTRDELAEMVNNIPADCSYMAGAVGHDMDRGVFTLRIDLTSKE